MSLWPWRPPEVKNYLKITFDIRLPWTLLFRPVLEFWVLTLTFEQLEINEDHRLWRSIHHITLNYITQHFIKNYCHWKTPYLHDFPSPENLCLSIAHIICESMLNINRFGQYNINTVARWCCSLWTRVVSCFPYGMYMHAILSFDRF